MGSVFEWIKQSLQEAGLMRIVNNHGFYPRTALDRAVSLRNAQKVNNILAQDRKHNPINSSGYRRTSITNGHEALYLSIRLGDTQIFHLLIDHWYPWIDTELSICDPADEKSWWTHNTVTFASMSNRPDIIKYLLNRGCDPNIPSTGLWMQSLLPIPATRSALSWACLTRSFESCKCLLERDVFIEPANEQNFWTPMICAAESGSEEIVKLLLTHNATSCGFSRAGDCALFAAVRSASTKCIDVILESGVDVNTYHPTSWRTALKMAAVGGKLSVVEHLFNRGAVMSIADDPGDSPLALAAANGHSALVQWLIDNGATVDLPDEVKHLTSPLAYAARHGHRKTVNILLEAGADPNKPGGILQISSPLRAAVRDEDNFEVVEALLAAGADPTAKLCDGQSPLDAAIAHKRQRSIEAMRRHASR